MVVLITVSVMLNVEQRQERRSLPGNVFSLDYAPTLSQNVTTTSAPLLERQLRLLPLLIPGMFFLLRRGGRRARGSEKAET